jgi:hypothetical protein
VQRAPALCQVWGRVSVAILTLTCAMTVTRTRDLLVTGGKTLWRKALPPLSLFLSSPCPTLPPPPPLALLPPRCQSPHNHPPRYAVTEREACIFLEYTKIQMLEWYEKFFFKKISSLHFLYIQKKDYNIISYSVVLNLDFCSPIHGLYKSFSNQSSHVLVLPDSNTKARCKMSHTNSIRD